MPDIFLYQGEANPNDIVLSDPTVQRGGGSSVNYTLTCASGSYVYTGQAATLELARKLSLAAGAYVYTGQAATLVVARNLSLAVGAYTYTGVAASLKLDRKLALAAGAYSYAGLPATLTYVPGAAKIDYVLACAAGAYVINGQDAVLTYTSGMSPRAHPAVSHGSKHPWIHSITAKSLPDIGEVEPEIIDAVIEAVATAVTARTIQDEKADTAAAERELMLLLNSMQRQWADGYAQLIRLEYERREQEMEDAAIALLLFDM
jgi:hypothetical protein